MPRKRAIPGARYLDELDEAQSSALERLGSGGGLGLVIGPCPYPLLGWPVRNIEPNCSTTSLETSRVSCGSEFICIPR